MSTTQSSSSGDGKAAKKESPKSTSTTESKSDSSTASSGGGKSSRDSIGGSKEVHYGYFSSVRTPEYRSGWDEIWGKHPRKKLRRTPAGFKKLQEAGDIDWTLSVRVEK